VADVDTRNVLARRGAHPLVGRTLCQWSTASLVRSRAFSRCVTVKPLPLERPSRLLLGPLFEFSHSDEDESAATDQPQLEADMFVEEIGRHPQCFGCLLGATERDSRDDAHWSALPTEGPGNVTALVRAPLAHGCALSGNLEAPRSERGTRARPLQVSIRSVPRPRGLRPPVQARGGRGASQARRRRDRARRAERVTATVGLCRPRARGHASRSRTRLSRAAGASCRRRARARTHPDPLRALGASDPAREASDSLPLALRGRRPLPPLRDPGRPDRDTGSRARSRAERVARKSPTQPRCLCGAKTLFTPRD